MTCDLTCDVEGDHAHVPEQLPVRGAAVSEAVQFGVQALGEAGGRLPVHEMGAADHTEHVGSAVQQAADYTRDARAAEEEAGQQQEAVQAADLRRARTGRESIIEMWGRGKVAG